MVTDLPGLLILRETEPEGEPHCLLLQETIPITWRKGRQRREPLPGPRGACRLPDASPAAGGRAGGGRAARPGLWATASGAPSEAADPLVAGQVAAGPRGSNVRRGMSRPQRQGNVGAGRGAATPTPRRPIHKTRRPCPGLAASSPNCKLIKEFASNLHGNHFLALNRATPPLLSRPLCLALPIQPARGGAHYLCPEPPPPILLARSLGGVLAEHPPSWESCLCPR